MTKKILIYLTIIIFSGSLALYAEDEVNEGVSFATTVMVMKDKDGKTFYAGTIPLVENMTSIFNKNLFLTTGSTWTWGYSHFFFDWTLFLGLRYYPTGKFFSFYSNAEAGTFIFNNITLCAHFGGDFEFLIDDDKDAPVYWFVGAEYFKRHVNELAGFVPHKKSQWYLSSDGFAVRLGVRARVFDINSLPQKKNRPLIL